MGKVKFIECTLEEYNSLETKDSDTLYFIFDRNIIYKGELPFPDSVTSTKDGIMSAADKTKLDGIEAGANKYVLPEASSSTLGGITVVEMDKPSYMVDIAKGSESGNYGIMYGNGLRKAGNTLIVTNPVPDGGTEGQVLTKTADGYSWNNVAGGDIWKTTKTAGEFYKADDVPTSTDVGKFDGYLYATRVYNAVWNDYAELFEKGEDIEFDHLAYVREDGKVYSAGESSNVVGIVTNNYGHLLGGDGDPDSKDYIPISLTGRVPVEISEEINIGDMVAANKNGTCRKATKEDFGCIVGKCVGSDPKNRENYVLVLVGMR